MKITRSELREKIMTILYQINIYRKENLDYDIEKVIKENFQNENEFVSSIVYGTLNKEKEIDILINKYLKNWTISRLGNIDRAIFRMSVYELMYTDTPKIVSINEGIELSKKYSDTDVTKMLNAVLDNILNNEVKNEWRNLFISNRR